jgi:L-lactate dehydrogenase complex protein LldG
MTGARSQILDGIRKSLGRGALSPDAALVLAKRLESPPPNLVPARSRLPHARQVDLFVEMAEAADATVTRVSGAVAVAAAVTAYLKRENLPHRLVMAPDPALAPMGWEGEPLLEIRRGAAVGDDEVGVSGAFLGIAETGTLMMCSGPESPATINFLPETHIVVLPAAAVRGGYEEGWAALRAAAPQATAPHVTIMPRTVNFITGPSRSADIEQTLQLGAHGPRRLHIVLVEEGVCDGPAG